MLSLRLEKKEILDNYYSKVKNKIESACRVSKLSVAAKNHFTSAKIKEIICSKPSEMMALHEEIIPLLGVNFSVKDFNKYKIIRKKKAKDRKGPERNLYKKYSKQIKLLQEVFNYENFLSGSMSTAYDFAKQLNSNTCTYCNRLYSNSVVTKDLKTGRENNKTRITRPHFDHWYAKSIYPILSMSFYNLIPSCYVCNSSIKGDTEFNLSTHMHPYVDKAFEKFSFSYRKKDVYENNVTINYRKNRKIKQTLEEFKISEVYNAHSEYELKDMLELRYKYSENYLDTLFNKTFDVSISKLEIYRMIFGVEYKDNEFHKRPFSKFKKDILGDLGIKL